MENIKLYKRLCRKCKKELFLESYHITKPICQECKDKIESERKPCKCGCGDLAKPGNDYVIGHNGRGIKRGPLSIEHKNNISISKKGKYTGENSPIWVPFETRICACGCERTFECKKTSHKKYILGHNNRGKHPTEETKRRQSESQRGKKATEETKQTLKIASQKRWAKESEHEKMSKAQKKRFENSEVWNTGSTKKTDKRLKKLGEKSSKTKKENFISGKTVTWNKGKTDIYSEESLEKMSKARKGISFEKQYGKEKADEIKRKLRVARIEQIERNGGCSQAYNLDACEYFKLFDEKNNTHGQYAVYGSGEYLVKGLGYFLDYINHGLKIIIEIYEPQHFNRDGTLRKKDVIREQEIKAHFSDYKFYWFYDYEMDKILEIILEKV